VKQLDSKQAQTCIHFSQLLLDLAQQQEWQRFEALLSKRDALIQQLVAKDYDVSEADAVRQLISRIKALDALTHTRVVATQGDTLQAIRSDAATKKAVNAYQKTQHRY
jgi:Spy/CpxP family protein refolding chaperone